MAAATMEDGSTGLSLESEIKEVPQSLGQDGSKLQLFLEKRDHENREHPNENA